MKHILVDGLIPPPPVTVLSLTTLLCTKMTSIEPKVARQIFTGYHALSAVLFLVNPEKPLLDTFPNAKGDTLAVGLLMMEVSSLGELRTCLTNQYILLVTLLLVP